MNMKGYNSKAASFNVFKYLWQINPSKSRANLNLLIYDYLSFKDFICKKVVCSETILI